MDKIGERLLNIRKNLFKTQEMVSNDLQISKNSIGQVERGDFLPSAVLLYRYMKTYNISLNYLFTGKGKPFLEDSEKEYVFIQKDPSLQKFIDFKNNASPEKIKVIEELIDILRG